MQGFGPEPPRMSRQQKTILIALGAVNFLIFCCAVPVIVFSSGGSSSQQVAAKATATRGPTDTPTLEPTSTPQPTATFVMRPPATSALPTVTPRSLEANWKFYDASPEGFGVALPSSWQKINLDTVSLAAYIQTLKEKNPGFATTFQGVSNQLLASQIKFFAIDASQQAIASNYVTSMNALREPLPTEMLLDVYVQANLTNLNKSGFPIKTPTHKRVTFTAGAAEEIKYQAYATSAESKKITVSVLQYALVRGKSGYVMTFGATPDKEKTYTPVFQKMMQSLQWVP